MQCFHQKQTNGTSNSLAIGSPQPPPTDSKGPSCSYEVLSSPGGLPAGRLALGQDVYHSWHCQNVYVSYFSSDFFMFHLLFTPGIMYYDRELSIDWRRRNS